MSKTIIEVNDDDVTMGLYMSTIPRKELYYVIVDNGIEDCGFTLDLLEKFITKYNEWKATQTNAEPSEARAEPEENKL